MGAIASARSVRPGERDVPRADGLLIDWGGARGASSPHVQVAEMQRARLLAAAVAVIDEHGYADATVARITARARVSRRTFYEMFGNCEECVVAVLEGALERIEEELARVVADSSSWQARMRASLFAILSFFDRELALSRVCVVQSLRANEQVLARRTEVLAQLARALDEGRAESARGVDAPPLTAEGLVGAAHAIVYERLLKRSPEPLADLTGSLMSMIVLPYLGVAAARREQARPAAAIPHEGDGPGTVAKEADQDPLEGVPMRLTYRTALVLEALAAHPAASNRQAGELAGVTDQGQMSKLLARLQRLGLIENTAGANCHVKGEANAWVLTVTGQSVVRSFQTSVSSCNRGALPSALQEETCP